MREGSATVEELQRELRNAGGSLAERDKVLSELRTRLSKSETEGATTQRGLNYLVRWVLLPVVVVSLLVTGTGLLTTAMGVASPAIATAFMAVVGLAAVWGIADWQGSKVEGVKRMIWYIRLRRWRRWVYGTLGTILLGLISRFIWHLLLPPSQ